MWYQFNKGHHDMKRTTLEKRDAAIQLRENGKSIKTIAKELQIAVGTVHFLVRDIVLPEKMKAQIRQAAKDTIREQVRARKTKLGLKPLTARVGSGYDPKGIGDRSMAQILAAFLRADMKVLMPFGDRFRYDLVVDEDGKFIRVQCKTARFRGDSFEFACRSTNWNTGKSSSYGGQCEVFAVYLRENNKVYIFRVDACPSASCCARLVECPQKNVRMADRHEFQLEKSLLEYP
jgi:DNA-binding CsgD family transcriptional regulator